LQRHLRPDAGAIAREQRFRAALGGFEWKIFPPLDLVLGAQPDCGLSKICSWTRLCNLLDGTA
jgi:hypothetical protein